MLSLRYRSLKSEGSILRKGEGVAVREIVRAVEDEEKILGQRRLKKSFVGGMDAQI